MTEALQRSFETVDTANSLIAAYVLENADDWRDGDTILSTIRSGAYADGLKQNWTQLDIEQRQTFFSAIEFAVATPSAGPLTPQTRDDVSTVWCTGFLELLAHYLDDDRLPTAEIIGYLGPRSLEYLNSWNAFNGLPPFSQTP